LSTQTPEKDPTVAGELIISDHAVADSSIYAPPEVSEIDLYQKREKIYTRRISGFFQRIRLFTGWPLLYGYFLLPWIQWDGHPAVLFDLPERKFHILWFTFWPQDFAMLAWLLALAAFALFLFTALFGRVWCGYTCPQTIWTSIFMWMEQYTEGSRNQRMKLDAAPWSLAKAAKKMVKHCMWLGFSFYTGFTFVGYFVPINELGYQFFTVDVSLMTFAWVMFFTLATYINAGWMREQVCMYMCPYARFQSAMFDRDTLIVSYDAGRGEPRGSRKRGMDQRPEGLGDCIDCQLCVQVCPTGIDIRNGLQYQCIGCALCIDACNSVMDKLHYPRGLIRYTTVNRLLKRPGHWLRPRIIGYSVAIVALSALLLYKLVWRVPLQLDVIRDRGQLYVLQDDGRIENSYSLNVINMDHQAHTYQLSVSGITGLQALHGDVFSVAPGEVRKVPVRLSVDAARRPATSTDIYFSARAQDNEGIIASKKSRFIVPTD
jgi:cytochrome c oxidase accessory protein FixG